MAEMYIPKIESKRNWDIAGLQKLIEKKKFYNTDPERREKMIAFVEKSEPTYENIYRVATDIQHNSKKAMAVTEIMTMLEKDAVHTEFSVDTFNPFDFD